mmetsp:Transcript_20041/g.47751  ORF Transcript_20041/g.47751 Transcript_20041/m.47751 type:complete len:167 (+) Transcript_20041:1348-1848(+)
MSAPPPPRTHPTAPRYFPPIFCAHGPLVSPCPTSPPSPLLPLQVVPAQRVKESADSVRELVESAGWPTPPGDIMRSIVEAAADAKRCISFDILVRSMCESEALCSWVSDEVRTLDASARHAAAASRAALEFRARVDADILAGNDSASMVPPRSPDRAKGRRGKGQR